MGMKILAIDTSCDETSAAVSDDLKILSNVVHSQILKHRCWGGVVPHIAKREHQKYLGPIIKQALKKAGVSWRNLSAIAVTYGPGLAIALEVGIRQAKELAKRHQKPLLAVDHMEGHLLSAFAKDSQGHFGIDEPKFPAIGLLVSGGHTELVLMTDFGRYKLIGQTVDDAAGEAFDKVGAMLGFPYPGGPHMSRLARIGDPSAILLPIPMQKSGDLNFSFAGLKTACLYRIREQERVDDKFNADLCASFEQAVVSALLLKLDAAIEKYGPKMLLLGGGVMANQCLQKTVQKMARQKGIRVYLPFDKSLLLDNAAMIGVAAFYQSGRGKFVKDIDLLDRQPRRAIGN